jgi:hypothetical protein
VTYPGSSQILPKILLAIQPLFCAACAARFFYVTVSEIKIDVGLALKRDSKAVRPGESEGESIRQSMDKPARCIAPPKLPNCRRIVFSEGREHPRRITAVSRIPGTGRL